MTERVEHEEEEYRFLRVSSIRCSTTFPVLNFGVRKVLSSRVRNEARSPTTKSTIPRKRHVSGGVKACNFTILRKGANSKIVKIPRNFTRVILQNEMRKI